MPVAKWTSGWICDSHTLRLVHSEMGKSGVIILLTASYVVFLSVLVGYSPRFSPIAVDRPH